MKQRSNYCSSAYKPQIRRKHRKKTNSHRKPTDVLEISYGGPETSEERGITFGTKTPNNECLCYLPFAFT